MTVKIKDPGSALTHFIGMMMAMFASTPLLIKASRQPEKIHIVVLSIFMVSMMHEVFHVFVMGGSICHFIVMYAFIAGMPVK